MLASGALGTSGADVVAAAPPVRSAVSQPAELRFGGPARVDHPWLPLSVHHEWVLAGVEGGQDVRAVSRPLTGARTLAVGSQRVAATVIETRRHADGVLRAVELAYYAQAIDRSVYRLGLDVDRFAPDGSRVGAEPGTLGHTATVRGVELVMPATPRLGPPSGAGRSALEPVALVDVEAMVRVPRGRFRDVLVTSTRRPGGEELGWYARGVGLIRSETSAGALELTSLR